MWLVSARSNTSFLLKTRKIVHSATRALECMLISKEIWLLPTSEKKLENFSFLYARLEQMNLVLTLLQCLRSIHVDGEADIKYYISKHTLYRHTRIATAGQRKNLLNNSRPFCFQASIIDFVEFIESQAEVLGEISEGELYWKLRFINHKTFIQSMHRPTEPSGFLHLF